MYGPRVDVLGKHTRKGARLLIEGRLKQDVWQDKEGNTKSKLIVVIENFEFVDAKPS